MGERMNRLKHAWNTFTKSEEERPLVPSYAYGASYGSRPDRVRLNLTNERSIISSIYTRIAIDVAAISLRHTRVDLNQNDRFIEHISSGLDDCLNFEANIDQAGRAFRQDMAMSLFDKGVIAVVPVDTSISPNITSGYDIKTMRVGEVLTWYPRHVRVRLWNDKIGRKEEIIIPKKDVAIIENPLYSVMNEPNSTLQRLIRKLNLLDAVDEQAGSGKLDLIVQLPYTIKTEARREQAENRRKDIEFQLKGSQYGIAYTDGTEKITQLNRPAENNMLKSIEYLTDMLYGELGLTPSVFDGTADEKTMLNYHNRTVEPILAAFAEGLKRAFITKTARSQGQTINYFRDPFKLVTIGDLAELSDKLTRNEILTSNEVRGFIGFKPSTDPKADKLLNKNLPEAEEPLAEVEDPFELKQIKQ